MNKQNQEECVCVFCIYVGLPVSTRRRREDRVNYYDISTCSYPAWLYQRDIVVSLKQDVNVKLRVEFAALYKC